MSKSVFRTQYDRVQVNSCPGSRFKPSYKLHYTETGSEDLIECGCVDTYEEIQSWKDSCDVETIVKRFLSGDLSALHKRETFFADVTDCPTTLAGFLQMKADADRAFYQLPVEVRDEFNQSSSEFFAQIGTDHYKQVMSKFQPPQDEVIPSPAPEKGEVNNE